MSLICADDRPTVLFPAAFPAAACEGLLAEAALLELDAGGVYDGGDRPWRDAKVGFFDREHWASQALQQATLKANEAGNWRYDLSRVESVQYTEYAVGGHYDWHVDCYSHGDQVRKLSAVLQLDDADAYEGGDLEFRRFGPYPSSERLVAPPALRQRGSVVVFPSYLVHRVAPVTAGVRRTLTIWLLGPRYR